VVTTSGAKVSPCAEVFVLKKNAPATTTAVKTPKAIIDFVIVKKNLKIKRLVMTTRKRFRENETS